MKTCLLDFVTTEPTYFTYNSRVEVVTVTILQQIQEILTHIITQRFHQVPLAIYAVITVINTYPQTTKRNVSK